MDPTRPAQPARWPYLLAGCVVGLFLPALLCVALGVASTLGLAVAGAGLSSSSDTLAGEPRAGDAVGVIRVEGPITGGSGGVFESSTTAYADQVIQQIRRAKADPSVKAVVLRVNSPGGGVVASDEIYQELKRLGKPIVASMGDTAASGGYYIAMAASKVYANPNTVTGSIGVIAQTTNVEELLDKIGVRITTVKSAPFKDLLSPYRPSTDEERAILQRLIDESYDQFVGIVAEGRRLDPARARTLADGRIYSGRQAQELGLLDTLGGLPDAIEEAGRLGGIRGRPRVIELRGPVSPFAAFLGMWGRTLDTLSLAPLIERQERFKLEYRYIGP